MARAEFGKQIRLLRERDKLSQSEAAETWGVNLRTLQDWELGRSTPTPFFSTCVLFYLRWRNRVPKEKGR